MTKWIIVSTLVIGLVMLFYDLGLHYRTVLNAMGLGLIGGITLAIALFYRLTD